MEIKDKTPAGGKNKLPEDKPNDLLKQKINIFLIGYFGYLTLAAAVTVAAIGGWLFIFPRYQEIAKENKAARQNLQSEFERQAGLLNSMVNLKKAYRQISEEDRKKISGMAPAGDDPSGLIPVVESIALKNNVVLNSLKIEPMNSNKQAQSQFKEEAGEKKEPPAGIFENPPPGAGRVRLEVNLSSLNYPVLKNVIKTFENNVRLFDVARVNYSVSEKKAALTVYAYYLITDNR